MQMVHRKKYDTFLVWLYLNGMEHLIPKHIRDNIPHSTISTWRNNVDYNSFYGHELRAVLQQAMEQYILQEENRQLKLLIRVIIKSWLSVAGILMPVIKKNKEYHELLINEVQRLFTVIPKRTALKIARISSTAFSEYLTRLKFKCGISPAQLCVKRHPLQLSLGEIENITSLFADAHPVWPASSIYYKGLREGKLYISQSTFYKYTQLLGLKRPRYKGQKKTKGLVASKPNEYLHVDTTFFELDDGSKVAVAFVSDNFSKIILGSSMSLTNKAHNVVQALEETIQVIQKHHPSHLSSTLVADGGSENHAEEVEILLEQTKSPMFNKVIALKSIRYSNSPVEAINKIVKQYLRYYKPKTAKEVIKVIEYALHDYNEIRPHGSLKGLIPMEAYLAPDRKLSFKMEIKGAVKKRIEDNQKANCLLCQQRGC
jgi:transposase InsO family protein